MWKPVNVHLRNGGVEICSFFSFLLVNDLNCKPMINGLANKRVVI